MNNDAAEGITDSNSMIKGGVEGPAYRVRLTPTGLLGPKGNHREGGFAGQEIDRRLTPGFSCGQEGLGPKLGPAQDKTTSGTVKLTRCPIIGIGPPRMKVYMEYQTKNKNMPRGFNGLKERR